MEMKNLLETITVHTGLLNELLQVLERETSEMADIDTTAMNLSNQAKSELIARISTHASLLEQAISSVAVREGLPGSASLGVLAEHVAKRGFSELLTCQQQIRRVADNVQQVADMNRGIAERFSLTITTSLNLISRVINQSNVYGSSGGYQQRLAGAVMINREA